jgi:hypothetical protein
MCFFSVPAGFNVEFFSIEKISKKSPKVVLKFYLNLILLSVNGTPVASSLSFICTGVTNDFLCSYESGLTEKIVL